MGNTTGMATHCCIKDCASVEDLFLFPARSRANSRRKQWINAVRRNLERPLWTPTRYSAICKIHFKNGNGLRFNPQFHVLREAPPDGVSGKTEVEIRRPHPHQEQPGQ